MVLFYTHILLGIVVFLLTKDFFQAGNNLIFFLMVMLGSILPDIDEKHSKMNRWSGFIGNIAVFLTKHRGFFHSLLFFIILFLAISYYWQNFYAEGLLLGYFAHLMGDGVTKMGVQIFYPFSRFKFKGPVRVGGMFEFVIMALLIIFIAKQFL